MTFSLTPHIAMKIHRYIIDYAEKTVSVQLARERPAEMIGKVCDDLMGLVGVVESVGDRNGMPAMIGRELNCGRYTGREWWSHSPTILAGSVAEYEAILKLMLKYKFVFDKARE